MTQTAFVASQTTFRDVANGVRATQTPVAATQTPFATQQMAGGHPKKFTKKICRAKPSKLFLVRRQCKVWFIWNYFRRKRHLQRCKCNLQKIRSEDTNPRNDNDERKIENTTGPTMINNQQAKVTTTKATTTNTIVNAKYGKRSKSKLYIF